jgi:hypothetical protein
MKKNKKTNPMTNMDSCWDYVSDVNPSFKWVLENIISRFDGVESQVVISFNYFLKFKNLIK